MKERKNSLYAKYIKRVFDIILSAAGMLLFWPIYLIVAFLVRVKLGSPVIFCQKRPGRDGKIFKLYKFRTMTDERDENGRLLPDEARITRFGKALRSTSLDELPELFNIFRGEMSIIGPRSLTVQYLPYYNEVERHRHDMRPGLTGLAQVSGRGGIGWEERFSYDIRYIKKVCFTMDIWILLKTVQKVFLRENIAAAEGLKDFDEFRRRQIEENKIQNAR